MIEEVVAMVTAEGFETQQCCVCKRVLLVFFREGQYRYKPGTTPVLTKTQTPLSLDVVDATVQMMDTE